MTTAFIAFGAFVVVVALLARLKPGKTDKDLVFEHDERVLYECQNLDILRYPKLGFNPVSWPRSKIQITNKRVVFSQKGLLSNTYVIREIAVRESNPPESWKGARNWWGLVPIYEYERSDFSLAMKDKKTVITFRNHSAPNLGHMEISGVASIERFMEAV